MLGFDALGRLALGQLPFVAVFLTGTINFSAQARAQFTMSAALTGRINAQGKIQNSLGFVTINPHLPLLLNSSSQYGASYWKGRD